MVYEIIKTQFDILSLQKHLELNVFSLEPVRQSEAFGGWSVLSSDGNYADGWHRGHQGITNSSTHEDLQKIRQQLGAKKGSEYRIPTNICSGYLQTVIERIKDLALSPYRARIIKLTAGHSSVWHYDTPAHIDSVRLHVPIITNPECFFEIENERAHMPANGDSYFVRVNRLHRVVNNGSTDRYHLVMDVADHKGISQFHKLKG